MPSRLCSTRCPTGGALQLLHRFQMCAHHSLKGCSVLTTPGDKHMDIASNSTSRPLREGQDSVRTSPGANVQGFKPLDAQMRRHQQQLKHNWQTCTMQDLMYSLLYPHLYLSSAATYQPCILAIPPPSLIRSMCHSYFHKRKSGILVFLSFYFATVPHPAV